MATDPTEIQRQLNRDVECIRGYVDLTDEAKHRRITEAYEKAKAEYEQAIEDREREIRERVANTERTVFATTYPYGATDAEQVQIRAAHRAAYNLVYQSVAFSNDPTYAEEELERLLQRAEERTGDPELATAVYHVATERRQEGSRCLPREAPRRRSDGMSTSPRGKRLSPSSAYSTARWAWG